MVVGLGCCLVAVAEKVGAAKTAEEEAAAAIDGVVILLCVRDMEWIIEGGYVRII